MTTQNGRRQARLPFMMHGICTSDSKSAPEFVRSVDYCPLKDIQECTNLSTLTNWTNFNALHKPSGIFIFSMQFVKGQEIKRYNVT